MGAKPMVVANLLFKSCNNSDSLICALEDYLIAALWKVGQMWRDGVIDIYQEHICTITALTAIDVLRQRVTTQVNPKYVAVGGSIGTGNETLASKLIGLCLSLIGVTSMDLGGLLPPASLALAATHFDAKFVWVTHTHVTDVDSLLARHQELKNLLPTKTRIIIGGGGLSPAVRRSLHWCEYYETVSEMTRLESTRLLAS
jgi:methanogenic corrinoid protein MtbC1